MSVVNKKYASLIISTLFLVGGSAALVGANPSGGDAQITTQPVHDSESCTEDHSEHNKDGGTGCTAETDNEETGLLSGITSAIDTFIEGMNQAFNNLSGSNTDTPSNPQGGDEAYSDEDSSGGQSGTAYEGEKA